MSPDISYQLSLKLLLFHPAAINLPNIMPILVAHNIASMLRYMQVQLANGRQAA